MRTFFALKAASLVLFLATLLALLAPPKAPEIKDPHPEQEGNRLKLSFDDVRIDGRSGFKIRYDSSVGAEFKASAWGSDIARVAFDKSQYWFWIRAYDSRRYHACPVRSVESTDLIPPLRPSFLLWIVGECDEKEFFVDGEYEVTVEKKDGKVTSQKYSRDGSVEALVCVRAFQTANGRHYPALATLEIEGSSIEIDMGPVNLHGPDPPETSPPAGTKKAEMIP
jgi:hypothetical protein